MKLLFLEISSDDVTNNLIFNLLVPALDMNGFTQLEACGIRERRVRIYLQSAVY